MPMPLPTMSVENKTLDVMNRRDFTAPFLAALAFQYGLSGLSQPRLSQAFSGMKPLGGESATELWNIVQDIDDFCSSVHPVPVALKNPLVIKGLLDDFRTKKKAREEDFVVYIWALKLDLNTYFKSLLNGQLIRTVSLREAAPFESLEIANEAMKRLKTLKIDSHPDSFTNARRKQNEIINSTEQFSQVGL